MVLLNIDPYDSSSKTKYIGQKTKKVYESQAILDVQIRQERFDESDFIL